MSQVIVPPPGNNSTLTFNKLGNLEVLESFVLLIAIANMAVNVARIVKILSGNVCGKNTYKCEGNHWGYGGGYYNNNAVFRGPELLCYSVMVYVHSRLYTAVIEDDEETIHLWMGINVGLTIAGLLPGIVFPSLWGNDSPMDSESLIGIMILDFVQYGAILEYERTLAKKKLAIKLESGPMISNRTMNS